MNSLLRPRYGRRSVRSQVSAPATFHAGTPRDQYPAVARWHDHLSGLVTPIHETSGQGTEPRRHKLKRFYSQVLSLLTLAVLFHSFVGCTMAPIRGGEIEQKRLADGVYDGSYRHGPNSSTVRVTISEGKVVDIELIKHFASWKGERANEIIPQRIIAQQSTDVDAVSGATNSSRVIMNAVQEALEKAHRE